MAGYEADPFVGSFIAPNQRRLLTAAQIVDDELDLDVVERLYLAALRSAHSYGIGIRRELEHAGQNRYFLEETLFLVGLSGLVDAAFAWMALSPVSGGRGPMSKDPDAQRVWDKLRRDLIGPIQ